ncbi:MAG: hypothetical protein CL695_04605 [Chloroflexi bacterium]|jgi:hypothetical protein|nr:hypothetical protein [Chloroflexota bacterium]MDP6586986.1 hypothetical protein [Anaerolineales bacterium]
MICAKTYNITLLTTLFILVFSTFIPALSYAQPLAISDSDWQYTQGNSWGQNNSPQIQINKDNVDALEIKWLHPIAGLSAAPDFLQGLDASEGSTTPAIVVDGLVYIRTNWMNTIAIDAETGREVWSYQYNIDIDAAQERLPIILGSPHQHGFRYWETENVLLQAGMECEFYALDAATGEEKFNVGPMCLDVPGSVYPYNTFGSMMGLAQLGTYEAGRLFIGSVAYGDLGVIKTGRTQIIGIDMDNPSQIVWRIFTMPPQDRPVDDWALQECDIGWFFTIPCSQVEAEARNNLMNDWQFKPRETPHWSTGVTANWGQPVVDEDTGLLYMNTGNITPFFYTNYRPGPNLYGSAIIAIDMNVGKLKWWMQAYPRDPWDYDCNWSGFLVDDPMLGKVYVKGCKLGYLHVLDAVTGVHIHYIDTRAPDQVDPRMGNLNSGQLGVAAPLNPLSRFEMKELSIAFKEYQDAEGQDLNPGFFHGSFGSDPAYNDGTIFHYVQSGILTLPPWTWPENPYDAEEGAYYPYGTSNPGKATLVARDLVTGGLKWTFYYPWSNIRGFPIVTGNMVIMGHPDGFMRFLDEDTGELLREINLGGAMGVGLTIGKDFNGNSKIFVLLNTASGAGYAITPGVTGTLVAIGLYERAITTTSTTTTTITSTLTTTATSIVPAKTMTTTQEVTEEVGQSSTVIYAAVMVAGIAIIATAVTAKRKQS